MPSAARPARAPPSTSDDSGTRRLARPRPPGHCGRNGRRRSGRPAPEPDQPGRVGRPGRGRRGAARADVPAGAARIPRDRPEVTDEGPDPGLTRPGAYDGLVVNGGKATASTDRVVVPMLFPTIGQPSWRDTFLECRATACSRRHLGQDLIIGRMTPLVAAWDGRVTSLRRSSSATSVSYVTVQRADGAWTLNYLHVNDDDPGTDNGRGTARWASCPDSGSARPWPADSCSAGSATAGPVCRTCTSSCARARRGVEWSGVAYIPKPSLDAAQPVATTAPAVNWRPDGSLVRVNGHAGIYRVLPDNRRVLVPDSYLPLSGLTAASAVPIQAAEMLRLRFVGYERAPLGAVGVSAAAVQVVPAGTISAAGAPGIGAALPIPDGTMLNTTGNGERWLVWGGRAHRAANPTFQWEYRWIAVTAHPVTFSELTGSTPYGEPVWP